MGRELGTRERFSAGKPKRIWRLQYGPCWCHGLPGETGSFDFVRTSTSEAVLGSLDFNVLILSDRVIDGSRPVFLQVLERVPGPRLVVATVSCPAATTFWDDLPVGWTPVQELVPVDIHVDECVGGHPEALMAAVLDHALSAPVSSRSATTTPLVTTGLEERDAATS